MIEFDESGLEEGGQLSFRYVMDVVEQERFEGIRNDLYYDE